MDVLNIAARVIETDADHAIALEQMAELMATNPAAGSEAERLLKTVAVLVRDYESARYPIAAPDPVEAIKFRMEQQGLVAKNLIPYLGSRSRVSEVLSRKRPLSLPMIRSLHRGLGIPAASLLGDRAETSPDLELDLAKVPFDQMHRRGWIDRVPRDRAEKKRILDAWLAPVRTFELAPLYRRHVRSAKSIDQEKLIIWTAQVAKRALSHSPSGTFDPKWSLDFLREVSRISVFKDGPALVGEFLDQHGIVMIVEPLLSPWLDGAAMMCKKVPAIVAGRIRKAYKDYRFLSGMIGQGQVQKHFPVFQE